MTQEKIFRPKDMRRGRDYMLDEKSPSRIVMAIEWIRDAADIIGGLAESFFEDAAWIVAGAACFITLFSKGVWW